MPQLRHKGAPGTAENYSLPGQSERMIVLANRPTGFYRLTVTTIGLFEAKTKLSELCEQVAKRRQPVVITRRGRPLVRIEPVGPGKGMSSSVWDARLGRRSTGHWVKNWRA